MIYSFFYRYGKYWLVPGESLCSEGSEYGNLVQHYKGKIHVLGGYTRLFLAPKVLLDNLRPMIPNAIQSHPSRPSTYSCEDDLSIEDLI